MATQIEQRSDEWFAARAGKVTASKIADMLAKTAKGWGASRANYAAQLVAERLTGTCERGFTNAAMQWGVDTEADARAAYSFHADVDVVEVGFIDHPSIAWSGASPDGMVGDDGLVEIKCPNTATHIDTLLSGTIPAKYVHQMNWQMACTGRQWCDFASYDPRLPEHMRLFVHRLVRDDKAVAQLEEDVALFLAEVRETVNQLRDKYDPQPESGVAMMLRAG